jgi:hypothetical protein
MTPDQIEHERGLFEQAYVSYWNIPLDVVAGESDIDRTKRRAFLLWLARAELAQENN